jgi:hypothetical protein
VGGRERERDRDGEKAVGNLDAFVESRDKTRVKVLLPSEDWKIRRARQRLFLVHTPREIESGGEGRV